MDSPSEFEPSESEPSNLEGLPVDHQLNRRPDPGRPRVVFTSESDSSAQQSPAEQFLLRAPGQGSQADPFPGSAIVETSVAPEQKQRPKRTPGGDVSSSSSSGTGFFVFSIVFVLGMFFLGPEMVERYQYSSTRGKMLAEYDFAVENLGKRPLTDVSNAYQMVALSVRPSVVSINAIKDGSGRVEENGMGSGVIMSTDGFILTNQHVVRGADSILIQLHDRRQFVATLVGEDESSDLALLKIEAPDLIPATWGDSEQVNVGSIVWAIGSPYGFQHTVTSGIISGKNRPGDINHPTQSLLQTDAAVNPGNSGGPLVDAQGRVIGINTSIFGDSFQGISFAVPSETAKFIYRELSSKGTVTRGYLGVKPVEVKHRDAMRLQLPDLDGAMLSQVVEGAPAFAAGIRSFDIIRQWDDVEVKNFKHLYRLAEMTRPQTLVQVKLIRDGKERVTQVVVGKRPENMR
ncbi:MAG: trypsin-like peptidase domain-containing protein [Mariniblastus sp.]|nr:trypsin-like peptidase domain-containing protein [Mariniblastus sp.]MDG2181751.1 trypsin-like peptidase domain-containing protein [Mariniblastus sp.]